MDIAGLVDYEREFKLDIVKPGTDEKIGLTFWLVHLDAASVDAKREARRVEQIASNTQPDTGDIVSRDLPLCITRWDWGGHGFGTEGEAPELNAENAVDVMTRARWIAAQVLSVVTRIENFMDA